MNLKVFACLCACFVGRVNCKTRVERKVIHMTVRHQEVFEVSTDEDDEEELKFRRRASLAPEVVYHEVDFSGKYACTFVFYSFNSLCFSIL